jgi:hypothetical protein
MPPRGRASASKVPIETPTGQAVSPPGADTPGSEWIQVFNVVAEEGFDPDLRSVTGP